jgi:predicted membrane channel-forming protein YqfA (hemolysin III family)
MMYKNKNFMKPSYFILLIFVLIIEIISFYQKIVFLPKNTDPINIINIILMGVIIVLIITLLIFLIINNNKKK